AVTLALSLIFDGAIVIRDGVSWISLNDTAASGNGEIGGRRVARIDVFSLSRTALQAGSGGKLRIGPRNAEAQQGGRGKNNAVHIGHLPKRIIGKSNARLSTRFAALLIGSVARLPLRLPRRRAHENTTHGLTPDLLATAAPTPTSAL